MALAYARLVYHAVGQPHCRAFERLRPSRYLFPRSAEAGTAPAYLRITRFDAALATPSEILAAPESMV